MIDKILMEIIDEQSTDDTVAVHLSAGVDSLTCAFASARLGKKVVGYSFFLDGQPTTDSMGAEEISKIFGFDFVPIDVPVDAIEEQFFNLIRNYECKKKTQVECTFPFLYVYPEIKEIDVISGIAADGWYGSSKKVCINFKEPKSLFDSYRESYFASDNIAGLNQQLQLAKEFNKNYIAPYLDDRVRDYMMKLDWYDINKPFNKAPIVNAFPEFKKIPNRRKHHENLQLVGRVDKYFETLLDNPLINVYNRSRVMDLVRDHQNTSNTLESFI